MIGAIARSRRLARVALALIVVVAAALRLAGLDWDDGTRLHPDERFLTMVTVALGRGTLAPSGPDAAARTAACRARYPHSNGVGPWLDTACSDLAPPNVGYAFFPYGVLPPAAVSAVGRGLERIGLKQASSYAEIPTLGRIAATLADLITLACTFALGSALGGRRAGLVAAALYALAPLPLQLARFYTVDPFATAFAALGLVVAWRAVDRGRIADLCAFGIAIGLASACKLSLAPLVALAVPIGLLAPMRPGAGMPPLRTGTLRAMGATVVAVVVALATFRVAQPTLFAGPGLIDIAWDSRALASLQEVARMLDGAADTPPAWQWIGRLRGIEPLRNLLIDGLGPAFALAAVAGLGLSVQRVFSGPLFRHRATALILIATIGYGAFVFAPFVSSMRYALPLVPLLAALAGFALAVGAARMGRRVRVARALPALAVAGGAVLAAAWLAIPMSAPTRLWASHWLLERVAAGVSAPLVGESGALPRRVNWPADGVVDAAGTSLPVRTTVTVAGSIDRLELRLAPDAGSATSVRVTASIVRDDGKVLLAPTALDAKIAPRITGFDGRDRVLVATLPAPVTLGAGWKVDLKLSDPDVPLVLAGSAIATEGAWDDPVPMRMRRLPADTVVEPGFPGFARAGRRAEGVDPFGQRYFRGLELAIVHRDDEAKRLSLADTLDRASWVTVSSQRFYDAVARDPYRFPLTLHYYDALFGGRLGFDVVATFRSPPRLGPFALDTQVHPWPEGYHATRARAAHGAEEALSVYDHPPVTVLRKRADYDSRRVREVLAQPVLRTLEDARLAGPPATVGRVERLPAAASAAPDLLMLSPSRVAALEAMPPPAAPRLASIGATVAWYIAATLLGFAALPALVALMPGFGALAFGLARIAGVFAFGAIAWWLHATGVDAWDPAGLTALAIALIACGGVLAWRRRAALAAAWSSEALRAEIVFALAFAAALALRLANPDLWAPGYGGEKPMDFAILNSILRADAFPPPDPWFAGGRLNYYYGGFVPVAALAMLTSTPAAIAANLAVALWMALGAAALFGIARTIALALPDVGERRATLAGVVSAIAGVGVGNLGIVSALVAAPPAGEGLARVATLVAAPDPRWYWSPTRLVAERTLSGHEIHEFPFFTFLHGDLHAHLLALPLLVATLALALWLALDTGRRHGAWLTGVALLAIATGLARTANSWDWPFLTGAAVGAIVVGAWRRGSGGSAWRLAIGSLAWFAVLQLAVAWPFAATFATGGVGVQRYGGPPTPLVPWVQMYGLFAWVFVPWLVLPAGVGRRRNEGCSRTVAWARDALLVAGAASIALVVVGLAQSAWRGGAAPAWGAMLAVVALALRETIDSRAAAARRALAALVAVGFAVQCVPEAIVVGRDIGRQNTYFKLHLQSWIALAIATGPAAVALLATPALRAWRFGFAALAAVALAYVPIGTAGRAAARFPDGPTTLDGLAFLATATLDRDGRKIPLAGDRAIVAWLANHAPRGAVVVEAQLPEYQYGSRIASFTGLPTLLGYRFHQTQQRPLAPLGDIVNLRVANVEAIYRGADDAAARRAVEEYRVRYIVVGGLERAVYPAERLARFDAWVLAGQARVAFREGESTIYELDPRPVDGWPLL